MAESGMTSRQSSNRDGSDRSASASKRKRHRNRKRRNRRQSFLVVPELDRSEARSSVAEDDALRDSENRARKLGDSKGTTSLYDNLGRIDSGSGSLLDHRDQPMMWPRKDSRLAQSLMSISSRANLDDEARHRLASSGDGGIRRATTVMTDEESDDSAAVADDRTPLMQRPSYHRYGTSDSRASPFQTRTRRPSTAASSRCSPRGHQQGSSSYTGRDRDLERDYELDYDVNNPPSIPGSPKLGPVRDMGYDDAVVTGADYEFDFAKTPVKPSERRQGSQSVSQDMLIDVGNDTDAAPASTKLKGKPSLGSSDSVSPRSSHSDLGPESASGPGPGPGLRRRRTVTLPVEEDVCFPREEVSELAEDEGVRVLPEGDEAEGTTGDRRRRRRREWPDLSVLEEWRREEKEEERSGDLRVKKISEPVLIEGRLRPQYRLWRQIEDEAPYRFTYFNEEFPSTIHAQTISELVQPGGSFRELFIPDPPELEDSSDDEDDDEAGAQGAGLGDQIAAAAATTTATTTNGRRVEDVASTKQVDTEAIARRQARDKTTEPRALSIISEAMSELRQSSADREQSSALGSTPASGQGPAPAAASATAAAPVRPLRRLQNGGKAKRYGPRPTFWLDVLSPTDAEMRVIAKAFGIHALTAEDIMMQEAREKVELFRNYYFVNYRTFEQDPNHANYLEPVNMYAVVFREGVLSFHFSQTPHPANVRRRIRQLMDYLILSSDWISYALIDDITDVFGPLIQAIENEVDQIDEVIMKMHSADESGGATKTSVYGDEAEPQPAESGQDQPPAISPGGMLRRVGECRKKVMGMYRLLSNKADVVKGFAKRCNEQWEVAPKSEIGLYLGDIQDHILTMTSNLAHYETILSRAHSNYLAQINILMNERQERTADVLGKLTVLGTIVLPMNIICGMWGMNVKVPGQEQDSLWWFYSITAGLFVFAFVSFYVAKRVYRLV